jgi:uncharacterized repeat protein (TIGR01451 family)
MAPQFPVAVSRWRWPLRRATVAVWIGVLAPLLLFLVVLLLVSWPAQAAGSTYVGGPISASTSWTPADSPYIVMSDVTVQNNAVLTISPGVVVSFATGTGLHIGNLVSPGKLVAEGTSAQPITFTAYYSTELPGRGFWDGIEFSANSPTNTLRYCLVEYAGTGVATNDSDSHTIDHCTLRYNGDDGDTSSGGAMNIDGDGLTVTDNEIYDNELGLRLRKSNYNTITGNQIYNNDDLGVGFVVEGGPGGGGNTVTGNRIRDNGGVGLYLDDGSDNQVFNNHIYGNGGDGVWARNQIILQFSGNIVRGNGQNGFTYASINFAPQAFHSNVLCSNVNFELQNQWAFTMTAEGNWFGTNSPTNGNEVSGLVDFSPWISMAVAASPSLLPADGASTAALTLAMRGGGYAVPDGYTVTVSASVGDVSPPVLSLTNGQATATYTAGSAAGGVDVQVTDQCATLLFTDVLTLVPILDLAVVKSDGGLVIGPNKDYAIDYTITVSNVGQVTATTVVLTDILPLEATGTSGAWTCDAGVCRYAVGTLVPSATLQVSLPVQLDKGALSCPIVLTNTVQVADILLGGDMDPTDNVFVLTTTLDCLPDLVVGLNDNVGPAPSPGVAWLSEMLNLAPLQAEPRPCVRAGEWISYSVMYANTGVVTATQVVLTETLPEHTSYVGYGWNGVGDTYTRSLGSLPPEAGGVALFVVRVDSAPPDLRIEDEARIGGAERDLYPPDNVSYEDTPMCEANRVYLPLIMRNYTPSPPPPPPPPPPEEGYVSDVAVNPETNLVYVASPQLDAVFAVDPSGAGSITATIPVGNQPLGLAVVTTTNKIYAANLYSWSLTAIRGSDHTRLTDIYVGAWACKAAADSADRRVYVTNHLESDNGAAAIDSETDTFLYYYSRLNGTQGRYGIDVDPSEDQLFIAARDAGLIAIQDANQPGQDPQIVKLDPQRVPYVVAFNPTTDHLFVTAADDNLVVVLEPYSIQWNQGAWTTWHGRRVFLLEKVNAGWIKEIPVGQGAEEGIAVNPFTGYVYVTNADSDTVSIIQDDPDPAQIGWIMDLTVGEYPQGVDVDVLRNLIYVGNAGSRDLTVINGADHTVLKTIPLD